MVNYIKFLIVLLGLYKCHGYNLIAETDGDGFMEVCDESDLMDADNLNQVMQLNLQNEYADDMETLVTNGNITILVEPSPNEQLSFSMEILEWKRGEWVQTIYSIRRDDLCSSLFNPSEIWYPLTKNIPMEDRVCPPIEGTVYRINDMENRIELEDSNISIEGTFKIVTHIKFKDHSTCVKTLVNVWKN